MKKQIKKIMTACVVGALITGTTAMAATNFHYGNYTIPTENEVYTLSWVKQTNGSAYIDQRVCDHSVLICRVYNLQDTPKSGVTKLQGIDSGRMSYSGYGVAPGDTLRTQLKNSSSSGGTVTVGGYWRP